MVQAADPLIARRTFDAQTLITAFPPRFYDPNKQLVYAIACPPGTVHQGQIIFSRWRKINLPDTLYGFRFTNSYYFQPPSTSESGYVDESAGAG